MIHLDTIRHLVATIIRYAPNPLPLFFCGRQWQSPSGNGTSSSPERQILRDWSIRSHSISRMPLTSDPYVLGRLRHDGALFGIYLRMNLRACLRVNPSEAPRQPTYFAPAGFESGATSSLWNFTETIFEMPCFSIVTP